MYFPMRAPRSVSPSRTTYSAVLSVTPGFSVITRASARLMVNARLAMMDFPKAAVIGLIGDASAVPHDYMLDGLDLPERLRVQAEIEAKRRAGATVLIRSTEPAVLQSVVDEVWWFADGGVRAEGRSRRSLARLSTRNSENAWQPARNPMRASPGRWPGAANRNRNVGTRRISL